MSEKTRKDLIYVRKNQKRFNICKKKTIVYMSEKTRKDWIYVRKNQKGLNICKKKLEKIEYM